FLESTFAWFKTWYPAVSVGVELKFGNQTIYMGQALIWLATEAHLRQRLGQDITGAANPRLGGRFQEVQSDWQKLVRLP
ncbi:MAG: hypothetical protein WAW26_24585, partial [Anaerolineae bacterium]